MTTTAQETDRFVDLPADLMVHPTGGRATADAIPGARHVEIAGMGHHLATGVVDRLVEVTTDLVQTTAGGTR